MLTTSSSWTILESNQVNICCVICERARYCLGQTHSISSARCLDALRQTTEWRDCECPLDDTFETSRSELGHKCVFFHRQQWKIISPVILLLTESGSQSTYWTLLQCYSLATCIQQLLGSPHVAQANMQSKTSAMVRLLSRCCLPKLPGNI